MSRVWVVAAVLCLAQLLAAQAPPLPFKNFESWVVLTATNVDSGGTKAWLWRTGQVVVFDDINADGATLCAFSQGTVFPGQRGFDTSTIVFDNATRTVHVRTLTPRGIATCDSRKVPGELHAGGVEMMAPSAATRAQLKPVQPAVVNGVPCDVYQAKLSRGTMQHLLTWSVAKATGAPQRYVNQSWDLTSGAGIIYEADYAGDHNVTGKALSQPQCQDVGNCDVEVPFCAVNTFVAPWTLKDAFKWVCSGAPGEGNVNCTALFDSEDNWPNTITAHATWAFNAYYQRHIAQGKAACNFNTAGTLTKCSTKCQICRPMANATNTQLDIILSNLCPPNDTNKRCLPIMPGGSRYYPDTKRAHASWAMNAHYAAHRCIPGLSDACDFYGLGELVPCT